MENSTSYNSFLDKVIANNPGESEFHQAVEEVIASIYSYYLKYPKYKNTKILERLVEPERIVIFRIPWLDDQGKVQVNKGYRVEMNSAIGPYKGGLRFHPTVSLSILKFLAFEQVFKNSLTTLPMGGGKGGSNFDPKGKSDNEVMKFCQSFMTELFRHIGPNTDVPAGDIGVGGREIGYLYGQYKRLKNEFTGVLTGKGLEWGGSLIRPEATGYGTTYFALEMLKTRGDSLKGKTVTISGSGNVAQYACEKVIHSGGKVVTLSDSSGFIHDSNGIDTEKLEYVFFLKNFERGRIKEFAKKYGVDYYDNQRPWGIPCDVAMPCATQHEICEDDAKTLISNGCYCVAEGANMPSTPEAIQVFLKAKILYGIGKAANAGGVAVSGLEMTQNSTRLSWTKDEVNDMLLSIMKNIHETCKNYGQEEDGYLNYLKGANIGGFVKVVNAMLSQGVV